MKHSSFPLRREKMQSAIHSFRAMLSAIVAALLFLAPAACHNDNEWNQLPAGIAQFVSKYFPGQGVGSYTHSASSYHVRIDNGPGLTFDNDYAWITVDGYGSTLPQVFLFDQLPPKLYAYLQDTQQLDGVFGVDRDSKRYVVSLMDSSLIYTITTGEITGASVSQTAPATPA